MSQNIFEPGHCAKKKNLTTVKTGYKEGKQGRVAHFQHCTQAQHVTICWEYWV